MSDIRRYAQTALAIQEELPKEERELAHKIYANLIRMERLTYAWPHLGGWAGTLVGMALALAANFPVIHNWQWSVMIAIYYLIWFIIGVAVCKVLITNSKREEALRQFKGLQIADHQFSEVLKKLKELDPRMFQNLRKVVPEFNTAA